MTSVGQTFCRLNMGIGEYLGIAFYSPLARPKLPKDWLLYPYILLTKDVSVILSRARVLNTVVFPITKTDFEQDPTFATFVTLRLHNSASLCSVQLHRGSVQLFNGFQFDQSHFTQNKQRFDEFVGINRAWNS